MKAFTTENIRNLAVIGHGDAGKTQLVSSLLHVAGTTKPLGKGRRRYYHHRLRRRFDRPKGFAQQQLRPRSNTRTQRSISSTRPDTRRLSRTRVRRCVSPTVRSSSLTACTASRSRPKRRGSTRMNFCCRVSWSINKIDKEHADFGHALETAASSFARSIVPFTLPIGSEGEFQRRRRCRSSKGVRIRRRRQGQRNPDARGRDGCFRLAPANV